MSGLHRTISTTDSAWEADPAIERAIADVLEVLPADICQELNQGQIDLHDPAFVEGLTDHVTRLAQTDPRLGRRLLGKLIRLKKQIRHGLHEEGSPLAASITVTRGSPLVGRNSPCPCGSGRKYKRCCLRAS